MLTLLRLLFGTLPAGFRHQHDLLLENLFLRQQLQVALRSRRRPRLHSRDKLFWVFARRLHGDWRRHLVLVRPETVIRTARVGGSIGGGAPAPSSVACTMSTSEQLDLDGFLPPYGALQRPPPRP